MTTSPSTVKTTIIIATHGRPRLLRRTLESIVCCERPPGLDSILVVENGGRGGAEEVCASVDGKIVVRYTYVDEGNKSKALNRGLMEADTEFVCFFDDDVRLGTSTLTDYVGAASRYGPGHFLGGPVLPEFEEVPPQCRRR